MACYVTRKTSAGLELLVFDHDNDDPDAPSGTQVPAGGMTAFEDIETAAFREIEEETGLTSLEFVGQLGGQEAGLHDKRGPSMTTFVHVTARSDGPDSWEHTVHGDDKDEDNGMVFACRWVKLPLDFELAGEQGEFLFA